MTIESAHLPPMWPGFDGLDSATRHHKRVEFAGSLLQEGLLRVLQFFLSPFDFIVVDLICLPN